MKKYMIACSLMILAAALGCVLRTEHKIDAHITLDIRHIADQAESVLDFVEGKTDALPGMEADPAPAPGDTSRATQLWNIFNPMPVAYADSLRVTTSPLVEEIAVRMRARNSEVSAFKNQGCIGETNRGYVELRDCDAVKEAEKRNQVQQIVSDENKDRKALYNEIARLNRDTPNVNVAAVEAIYALERLQRAGSGQVVQLPPAGKDFDAVKNSALGQKLGSNCVAGVWVTIP